MSCYKPIPAWKSKGVNENGKSKIVFDSKTDKTNWEAIVVPCGQCIGCRVDRSRQWAVRCVHEASLYPANCFITLTYNDKNLDPSMSLNKRDFVLFMKKLRKRFNGVKAVAKDNGEIKYPIRFFQCGEYGDKLLRPHYHACLFNFDFDDKILYSVRKGTKLYISDKLMSLWTKGFSTVGDVTFQSAAYVARYITKKVNGEKAFEHYNDVDKETGEILRSRLPEYTTMSRRPGIGKDWITKYKNDAFSKDFLTIQGKKFKPPKYYDHIYDSIDPEHMKEIKEKRKEKANENQVEAKRLLAMMRVKQMQARKLIRSLEK